MLCSPRWKTNGDGRNRRGILSGGQLGFATGGGAPAVQGPREQAGYARLDLAKLLVLLARPGINGGGGNLKRGGSGIGLLVASGGARCWRGRAARR
jgi:hypothetical protein